MTSDETAGPSSDASTVSEAASAVILPGRRRGFEARLEQSSLVLKTPDFNRRIPITGIERIETLGSGKRGFAVVLTAPRTIRPTSWTVHGRSAPAVRAFTDALQRKLPVRDSAEPRADGTLLVTETPVAKPPAGRRRTASRVAVTLYLLAAAAMLTAGVLGAYEWYVALVCWLFGSLAIPLRHFVYGGWGFTRETWRLRNHGVLVEGRRLYAGAYEFTDLEGRVHQLTGTSEHAEQVEILYDPEGRTKAQVGRGTTGTLIFAVFIFLVSLTAATALVVLALAGPLGASHLISPGLY
ncbi:hypothetical protein [Streptomyces griseomycini]|uniref:Uncharacterized protein n=1 Tax=Streptomyces griseomycini TaxID=66895 RepID=A0A7W7LXT5_9ACTN|nr:hypothetical protein [Streptomyces griseomycini]MBB4897721.1 hypothetical protein [Streptomyces griseomycini]GGR11827.1 hypothetical protein GCM10015536_16710 [Streptomyces griseomycini]